MKTPCMLLAAYLKARTTPNRAKAKSWRHGEFVSPDLRHGGCVALNGADGSGVEISPAHADKRDSVWIDLNNKISLDKSCQSHGCSQ